MDDFQERIGAILANPQLMGQIMSMAQAMGQSQPTAPPPPSKPNPPSPTMQGMPDFAMLQSLMNTQQGRPNKEQQNLLTALRPFLGADKLQRLERALQAARLAQIATAMLGQMGGSPKGKQVNHV